jgi:stage II sporulation protein AA (anti-sigma F factor antagonist)
LLSWRSHSHGRLAYVVVEGELDSDTAPWLAAQLMPVADSGDHLAVDMARVSFCGAAGLNLCLRLYHRACAVGGSLHLVTPSTPVRRVILLASLFDVLPIAADLSTVITRLGRDIITPAVDPC